MCVFSHSRSGFANLCTKLDVCRFPPIKVVPKPIVDIDWKNPISVFPVTPYEVRNLRWSMKFIPAMKSSLLISHPTPADGKKPYFEFAPKREEPSILAVNVAEYLLLYV